MKMGAFVKLQVSMRRQPLRSFSGEARFSQLLALASRALSRQSKPRISVMSESLKRTQIVIHL
jgi:hypothetical protein